MKRRQVYRIDPRMKSSRRTVAIETAYMTIASWATHLANDPLQRQTIARSLAVEARLLIDAFGVKVAR